MEKFLLSSTWALFAGKSVAGYSGYHQGHQGISERSHRMAYFTEPRFKAEKGYPYLFVERKPL